MSCKFRCISNNPMLLGKGFSTLEFQNTDVLGLFRLVADEILKGYSLITHPLTSSVRPDITPYKTILLSAEAKNVDKESVILIEKAVRYAEDLYKIRKEPIYTKWDLEAQKDFQLIDLSIVETALEVEQLNR